jgi:imidazolonepropionase-like amidohydrolase
MRTSLPAGLVLALLVPAAGSGGKADVYALVGGKVVTVSGATLEAGTVILRDGLIEAVGTGLTPPPDARILDVKGLVVTPGIIDGFGGIGLPARESGRGTASPAPPANPLAPQALALDRIRTSETTKARDSGVTTALVIPREGVLPGRSVLVNLAGDKAEAMALKQPAALHLHMATLSRQYPNSLMGTMAYVRQALYDARRYAEEWAAYDKAPRGRKRPRYDAALDAWQDVLSGRLPLVVTAPRENDLRRTLALGDEFKVNVVAAGALEAFRAAELVKSRKLRLLVSVNFDPPRPSGGEGFGGPDEDKQKSDIEDAERNPAELHKAGVSFALVSGYAPDFLAGVRKAIEKGLPREAALKAVTLAPAEVLGVADRLGSLEAGKIANVVVWSGEPLTQGTKARMVFVDGALFEPDESPEARPSPAASPAAEVW